MFTLQRPADVRIAEWLKSLRTRSANYSPVGLTHDQQAAGFRCDHNRVLLGLGHARFLAARSALRGWQQLQLGWLEAWPPNAPIEVGEQVAVIGRSLGLWSTNAARIIYVIDEEQPRPRFGFAYGTLPGHVAQGEERFLVESDKEGAVWYDILAYSRPEHPLARLGYPWLRRVQKRFARESMAAMQRYVAQST